VVGTGGAVRPFILCLSAQGPWWTDPTIAPAFDGLKHSRLSQGFSLSTTPCLGRHSLDLVEVQPVSQSTGFPQCPTARRLRSADSAIY
jgi:hypothetical protein